MSKIIEFERNLTEIWPKQNTVCFRKKIGMVMMVVMVVGLVVVMLVGVMMVVCDVVVK